MITEFGRMGNARVAQKVLQYLSTQNRLLTAQQISPVISENAKDVEHAIIQIVEKSDWLSIIDTKSGLSAVRNGTRELDIERYLKNGGFIKECEEIEALDLEIKQEKERRKLVEETTIALNKHSIKNSRIALWVSFFSFAVALAALLVSLNPLNVSLLEWITRWF